MREQNDSIIALSKQSPIDPIATTRPESIARRVNSREVNCVPGSCGWWSRPWPAAGRLRPIPLP